MSKQFYKQLHSALNLKNQRILTVYAMIMDYAFDVVVA
jgi:hypothetical protein